MKKARMHTSYLSRLMAASSAASRKRSPLVSSRANIHPTASLQVAATLLSSAAGQEEARGCPAPPGAAPHIPSLWGRDRYRWWGWRGVPRSRSAWHSHAGAGTSRAGGHPGRPDPARCTVLGGPAGQCQAGQSSGTVPRCPAPRSPCLLSPAGLCGVGQGHCPSHRTVSCLLARHACCSSLHCGAAAGRRQGDTGHRAPSPRRVPLSLPPSCRCGHRSRRRQPPGRRGRACSPRAPWGPAA